jgi:membrane protease YdiL (CAAX protease family)
MRTGTASGFQIAFLTFACMLLAVPVSRWIVGIVEWQPRQSEFISRAMPLLMLGTALLVVAPLRRWCAVQLRIPISDRRREVFVLSFSAWILGFAAIGGAVVWRWMAEGPAGVAQWVRGFSPHEASMAAALSLTGFANLILFGIVAPIAEELVFRGMLYRAWVKRFGWLMAAVLSSLVFAAYHGQFVHSFIFGLVCVALYRRTGTLLAPILMHGVYNTSISYPALGQFLLALGAEAPGDLGNWAFHLACLVIVVVGVPAYLFMARDSNAPSEPAPDGELLPR